MLNFFCLQKKPVFISLFLQDFILALSIANRIFFKQFPFSCFHKSKHNKSLQSVSDKKQTNIPEFDLSADAAINQKGFETTILLRSIRSKFENNGQKILNAMFVLFLFCILQMILFSFRHELFFSGNLSFKFKASVRTKMCSRLHKFSFTKFNKLEIYLRCKNANIVIKKTLRCFSVSAKLTEHYWDYV